MRHSFMVLAASAAVAVAGLVASSASAAVVYNVQLGPFVTVAYTGTAAGPGSGTQTWNLMSGGTLNNITTADGGSSTVDVVMGGTISGGFDNTSNLDNLLSGHYWLVGSNVRTFTIQGLPDGSYDLYAYNRNQVTGTYPTKVTIGAQNMVIDSIYNNSFDRYAAENQGHVWNVMKGISPVAGDVTFSLDTPNGTHYAQINGFQLVVPEPASLGLIGLSVVGLLTRRRQVSK